MADYQLTATDSILRTVDGAFIPRDMANMDYNGNARRPGYLQWVEAGGVPDPYVPPPEVPPEPTSEDQLLFDHENRLRSLEGQSPLALDEFMELKNGGP